MTMKLSAALSRLTLAASVLLLAGCPKKPDRPTADMTEIRTNSSNNSRGSNNPGDNIIFSRPVST